MKNILPILLLFLISNNSFSQEVFDEASMTLEAGKIIDEANSRIVRTDSVIIKTDTIRNSGGSGNSFYMEYIPPRRWKRIKHYDSNNNLVMVQSKQIYDPPVMSTNSALFIYDANNNYILECRNDEYGTTWLLALFKYNEEGRLIEHKYWNMESIGKKVYNNPKKPKKYTFYNSDGKKVRSWRKAKRKVPYIRPKYNYNPARTPIKIITE